MTPATEADRSAIEAFLGCHAEQAMFPLSNLRDHGMAGGHGYAVRFWLTRDATGITDVLTLTDGGMILPFLPSGDYAAAMSVIADRPITGLAGPMVNVRGMEALGFAAATRTFDHDEPHFLLDLPALRIPDGPGDIHPLWNAPVDLIKGWIADYDAQTLNVPTDRLTAQADQTYSRYVAMGSHVVLMDGTTPLAMTGFNAQLPDIVQLGGVYTPPDLRGRGYARRAVALHLAQARRRGVARATLFSASEMAARAYKSVGFEQIGDWSLILFDGPQRAARI